MLIVGFAWAYDEVRSLHGDVVQAGLRHGRDVLHIDRVLHMNWAGPMNAWLGHHAWVGDALAGYYVVMHLGMTALLLLILWIHGPRYRDQRNALMVISLIGLGVYWLYPTAPPRLIGAGFHDTVAAALPFAYQVETARANLYAAMPSLHLAWAVWVTVVVWSITTRWWLRLLAVLHPILTSVTVLATGNHYTFDLITGVALTAIGYLAYDAALALVCRRSGDRDTPRARRRTAGS